MIPLSLGEIAAVVGGRVEGDGAVTVTAPALLDGWQAASQALADHVVARLRDGLTVVGLTGSQPQGACP
jgi:UDP-N-acetylmuramoyl-tripeptide--D-alanyl-D-alanine ligase